MKKIAIVSLSFFMSVSFIAAQEKNNGDSTQIKWRDFHKYWYAGLRMTYGKKKFRPFMKMAFVLGIFPKMNSYYDGIDGGGLVTSEWKTYSGGLAFGFNGSAGIYFDQGKKISYSFEMNLFFQNW